MKKPFILSIFYRIPMKISKPTFLIDKARASRNIQKIVQKTTGTPTLFRPHFKTHQSNEIGNWFQEFGVSKITVSSVDMATYFAQNGWQNITIAFPMNILEIERINHLAATIQINLVVESTEVAAFLVEHIVHPVGVFIKIDTGYGRTGVWHQNTALVSDIMAILEHQPMLKTEGFLSHFGHSYAARSAAEIKELYQVNVQHLFALKKHFGESHNNLKLSIGDTPTCSVVPQFDGIDEIRPGNMVYYDLMQWQIGACLLDEIAVTMACPVVALHPKRNEIIIHGGGVHFSKDSIEHPVYGKIYGLAVRDDGDSWQGLIHGTYIKKVSQEHGTIVSHSDFIKKCRVGSVIKILPIHSCMTANLMRDYLVV